MDLNQCQLLSAVTPVTPALIALLGVIVGGRLSAKLTFQNQFRLTTLQSRQQSYAAIMGKKFLITQLYVSRFEAFAYSEYHERLWHLAGSPKESLDIEEAKHWMRKSEDFVIDIAKANQSLIESVGIVRATYPLTAELDALTERIYHFKTPVINPPSQGADRVALDSWKAQTIQTLQQVVEQEYAEPINALLTHLKQNINAPVLQ
jgi:hypothetical protein